MNTLGFQRGYMAKNMNAEDFVKVIVKALSREFQKEVSLDKTKNNKFIVSLGEYKTKLSKEFIDEHKTPYGLDRFILEDFEKQGFKFEINRSQYIQYCFGVIDKQE